MLKQEEIDEIEEFVRPLVNGGFTERDDVAQHVTDYFEDQFPEQELEPLVARVWAERLAEQATWPAETETERVLNALDSLSAKGIVARANFTCCATCGAAEIGIEAKDGDRGYVFFHQQDTESAAVGGGLYLSYGTFDDETDAAAIAEEIVAALTTAGATTVWNGDVDRRILVSPLRWQVRLK
ncbi:DUF6891 domain-containing protein [Actinophytocola oryzae]|uniref:DUF6891 domain-containing protein n=1 Tax=Actinophytocola oryzae TaxID=502181 RepID=A0A4R7VB73_9PSEU|nr:hypothetical protein [Actinophytocola oryzae]TDV46270.1 hypothetical protein CLV71_111228 [Actinophytocola oryzae]